MSTDDFTSTTGTTGTAAVGGTAAGEIDHAGDRDWFAVEFVAGRTYTIDLRGSRTNDGTLYDPFLRGVYDASGNVIGSTANNDGGEGANSHLVFTATESGTYYIAASASGSHLGTYELEVRGTSTDDVRTGATDLGDITNLQGPRFPLNTMDGDGDRIDYYRFTLTEAKEVALGLRQQDANADLFLEDAEGNVLHSSVEAGTANEWIAPTLLAGTYYVRVESQETGSNNYVFRYGVAAPDPHSLQQLEETTLDVDEAPAFAEPDYAFDLAENADGSGGGVALGTVSASDPESAALTYSIVGGNAAGLFEIDAATGALSYTGTGEDHESGTTSYELTVRANDGSLHGDAAVTVTVTDVDEGGSETEAGDDHPAGVDTTGTVAVDGSVAGEIDHASDRDWFAVEFVAGHTYTIDLRGSRTNDGTLYDPFLRGVYDASGNVIGSTTNNNGGEGANSHLVFTATESGTYYIAASASGSHLGTYELEVRGTSTDDVRTGATDLGDITNLQGPRFPLNTMDGDGDRIDYYRFTLTEAKEVALGLRQQDANADLFLEDAEGNVLYSSVEAGTANEWIAPTLLAGTYYVRVESQETGSNNYVFRYGVAAPDPHSLQQLEETALDVDEAPAFAETDYAFDLAENADGSGGGVALGTVSASDPDSETLTYSIVGGNAAGLFEIDAATGALSYTGTGEDHESGTTSYELTVRANDGSLHGDAAVTVTVTDVDESVTRSIRVSDAEAHEEDGVLVFRVELDEASERTVTVRYATADGTAVAGEDYESASGLLEFAPGETEKRVEVALVNDTVEDSGETFVLRLSDAVGGLLADSEGTGTIRNSESLSTVSEGETDFSAGIDTAGRVKVGESATGVIETGGDRDWFAVTMEAHKIYQVDLKGWSTGQGTLRDPYLRGIHDSNGDLIGGTTDNNSGGGLNSYVFFYPTQTGTYYVSAGSGGGHTGTYTLRVREGPSDPQTHWTDTTGTVAVDGTVTGAIDFPGDRDWFAVTLEAGTAYRIDMKGYWGGPGNLRNPYLRGIYDSDGNLIDGTTDNDGGDYVNSRVIFTPTQAGTYYVSAGANGGNCGTYTLSVKTDDALSPGTDTTGRVAVDGSVTGQIDYQGDRDWFAVTLEADTIYRIDLEGYWTSAGTLRDPYLAGIYDSDGNLIDGTRNNNGGFGPNSLVFFTPTETGTYYVAAGSDWNKTGTYTLSVRDVPSDLQTAGTDTTGTVAVDGSVTGEIDHPGDQDWFAVTLEAGTIYRIDLEGFWTSAGSLGGAYLRGIYDSEGNPISGTTDDNAGIGDNSRVIFTPTENGTYYVSAGASLYGSPSYVTGTYTLRVREAPSDPQTAGVDTTGTVAVHGSVVGEIGHPGDRDWFAVTMEAGTTYRIDLEGYWIVGAGTLRDPYLYGIYDSDGNLIDGTTNNDGGEYIDSRVIFTPGATGTYYVSAGADERFDQTGTYTLSVTADAQTAGIDTTGTVAVDGSVTGEIDHASDRDWFAVTLETGTTYRIDLEGFWSDAGTLRDPYLYGIYDSDGDLISRTTNDDYGGHDSRVVFTPTQTGTYYVSAGGYGSHTGTYTLSVREVPGDAQTGGTDTTGTVAVDGSVTGEIDHQRDRDWFAVTLETGTTYRIDLEGSASGAGTLSDPYLRGIYDSNGYLISGTANDAGGSGHNSRVTFTAAADGTYYVSASAQGYGQGSYKLSVTEVSRDAQTAGTDTTGTVAVDGSVTGQIEYRGDRDWFAVTLVAGTNYRIDLEGSWNGGGTLRDAYLRGIYDSAGDLISGTTNDDGGWTYNSRVMFTPGDTGTYYVSAGADGSHIGTYTLSVEEVL